MVRPTWRRREGNDRPSGTGDGSPHKMSSESPGDSRPDDNFPDSNGTTGRVESQMQDVVH